MSRQLLAPLAIVVSLALAACGGSAPADTAPANTTAPTNTTAPADTMAPATTPAPATP